jgi:cell division protease FtsH
LGAAWYLPEERSITTAEQMLDEMCATLGGRASEDIIFGKVSTGALNDLERVTKTAYAMISYFGMSSKLGNISFYDSTGQNEYAFNKPYSEKTSELIDQEAKILIEKQYERAKHVLSEHKSGLIKLADLLLEKEVIFTEDVQNIFGQRKGVQPEEIQKWAKSGNPDIPASSVKVKKTRQPAIKKNKEQEEKSQQG